MGEADNAQTQSSDHCRGGLYARADRRRSVRGDRSDARRQAGSPGAETRGSQATNDEVWNREAGNADIEKARTGSNPIGANRCSGKAVIRRCIRRGTSCR